MARGEQRSRRERRQPTTVANPNEGAGYITARGARFRQRRALKHNDTFALIDAHGEINAASHGSDGLFHCDTRYLSHLKLSVLGVDPLLLGSNLSEDATYLRCDFTNSDIFRDGRIVFFKDQMHIERTAYVRSGMLRQQLAVVNYSSEPAQLTLAIAFDGDFADLFEVRGMRREAKGKIVRSVAGPAEVSFVYSGLDGVIRETKIAFDPKPSLLSPTLATYTMVVAPKERSTVRLDFECHSNQTREPKRQFLPGLIEVRRDFRRKMRRQPALETGNANFNHVLRRSAGDLVMLTTDTAEGPYPYAGIPWFSTAFGRDGLITAIETLWLNPGLARGVLRYLSRLQATAEDPNSDAEPGKILHEVRGGEMAALKEVPFGRYYGSVDSTPLFVVLASHYAQWTGDDGFLAEIWPNIEAALAWMDGPGDADADGFIEYYRATGSELVNQGWKDSSDAVFHADGALARGPIALVEVQAYAYEAKISAAHAARRLGKSIWADRLENAAQDLKQKFETAFWCEERGSYAMALDGDKRQCRVLSSNAGQALRSGIAREDRAHLVSGLMLGPSFFSGWGIRTIADTEARYNPMSYHNGSIWPHDNALFAAGLARYGHREGVERILRALVDAAALMDQRRLPELFCGFQRRRGRAPILYPVACSPQAWASGALFYLVQLLLGLEIDGHARTLRFRDPLIPAWLGHIVLRRIAVGSSFVDVRLDRVRGGDVALEVLANERGVTVTLT